MSHNRLVDWITAQKSKGAELKQTFRSLKNRSYRIYTAGQFVSLCGTWMQITALPWLVYTLTDSPAALGMVSFAGSLPLLLLTYFGGMIADRFDRRKVLLTMQTLAMIQASVLFLVTLTGNASLPLLVVLAVAGGTFTALDLPSRQAFVPDLVGKSELTNAIALNSAVWNSCRMIGPALAGLIIGVLGIEVCFGINAVTYIAAIATLMIIRATPSQESEESEATDQPGIWEVLTSPPVLTVLLLSGVTSTFGFQYGVLLPVVADKLLAGDATTMGYLSAAAGMGALFGSLALANKSESKHLRVAIGIVPIFLALSIAIISLSSWLALSLSIAVIAGASLSLQLSGGSALVQQSTDPRMRGRVMGVYSTFMLGFSPFAAILAGWWASTLGVTTTLLIASSVISVAAILYLTVGRRMIKCDARDDC